MINEALTLTSNIHVDYNFLKGCFAEVAYELKKKGQNAVNEYGSSENSVGLGSSGMQISYSNQASSE